MPLAAARLRVALDPIDANSAAHCVGSCCRSVRAVRTLNHGPRLLAWRRRTGAALTVSSLRGLWVYPQTVTSPKGASNYGDDGPSGVEGNPRWHVRS